MFKFYFSSLLSQKIVTFLRQIIVTSRRQPVPLVYQLQLFLELVELKINNFMHSPRNVRSCNSAQFQRPKFSKKDFLDLGQCKRSVGNTAKSLPTKETRNVSQLKIRSKLLLICRILTKNVKYLSDPFLLWPP